MARQLARELAIALGDWLEEARNCWLQEAQQQGAPEGEGLPLQRSDVDDANAPDGTTYQGGHREGATLCSRATPPKGSATGG